MTYCKILKMEPERNLRDMEIRDNVAQMFSLLVLLEDDNGNRFTDKLPFIVPPCRLPELAVPQKRAKAYLTAYASLNNTQKGSFNDLIGQRLNLPTFITDFLEPESSFYDTLASFRLP